MLNYAALDFQKVFKQIMGRYRPSQAFHCHVTSVIVSFSQDLAPSMLSHRQDTKATAGTLVQGSMPEFCITLLDNSFSYSEREDYTGPVDRSWFCLTSIALAIKAASNLLPSLDLKYLFSLAILTDTIFAFAVRNR
jgi:hypothetical protein